MYSLNIDVYIYIYTRVYRVVLCSKYCDPSICNMILYVGNPAAWLYDYWKCPGNVPDPCFCANCLCFAYRCLGSCHPRWASNHFSVVSTHLRPTTACKILATFELFVEQLCMDALSVQPGNSFLYTPQPSGLQKGPGSKFRHGLHRAVPWRHCSHVAGSET